MKNGAHNSRNVKSQAGRRETLEPHHLLRLRVYLFCEVVDDPSQRLGYQLGVPAELLHIYMRPVKTQ